jgi:hypothetical protein
VNCSITHEEAWLRVDVGQGLADEVQECYRAAAMECLRSNCKRILVLGRATFDPQAHLAGRDALRSLALAGVAEGFRLALVALTENLTGIYDVAVVEADRLGLEARRFGAENEAERWLAG